jgi:uncharacterized peroxidase-related enzyme
MIFFKKKLQNIIFQRLKFSTTIKKFKKTEPPYEGGSQPLRIISLSLPIIENVKDEKIEKYFQKCKEKLGFIPNVLLSYSHDIEKLKNFINMYNNLMLSEDSNLSKLEREMIATCVSSINRCYYCIVSHGSAVRELSEDQKLGELMAINYRLAELSERHREMLDFAYKLTTAPYTVLEEDRERLRSMGFSEKDIFHICEIIGFFNMSNRISSGIDLMPNKEYHSICRRD